MMEQEKEVKKNEALNVKTPNFVYNPNYETIHSETFPLQIDCVSWNKKYSLLAVGSYEIDPENDSLRIGSISILSEEKNFQIVHQISSFGVLDLKWENGFESLVAATSEGVKFFKLTSPHELTLESEISLENNIMALYIEWISPVQVIFGDSAGSVTLVEKDETKSPKVISVSKSHEYSVWVVHYEPKNAIIFSGADDGDFCAFNIKDFENSEMHYKKKFQVGVTSITSNKDLLAIGCYDDILRIFTLNVIEDEEGNKIDLGLKLKIDLGGAIWRTVWIDPIVPMKVEDSSDFYMGVSCARNGIAFVKFSSLDWKWEIITTNKEYLGFLAYGFDVKESGEGDLVIASGYFDNKLLQVWKIGRK